MKNIQETIKQLHGNICIFLRSIEQLTAENEANLVDTLQRHLIRSLCADMCDMIIREIDSSASARTGQLSIEVRRLIIKTNQFSDVCRNEIKSFKKCLNPIEVN